MTHVCSKIHGTTSSTFAGQMGCMCDVWGGHTDHTADSITQSTLRIERGNSTPTTWRDGIKREN